MSTPHLRPKDIPARKAEVILRKLNSFVSVQQLMNAIRKQTEQSILGSADAQRILHSREELGGFRNLRDLATVRKIGAKKFDLIARALSEPNAAD